MRDWDFGEVRMAEGYGEDLEIHLKPVNAADARAGGVYLTVATCEEINAACNRFFQKRNMPVGREYYKKLYQQRYYETP